MLKSWGWLSLLVIVLDQAAKYLAEALLVIHRPIPVLPSFNLMLTYNTGAAFSFLADAGGWQLLVFPESWTDGQHWPSRLAISA